MMEWEQPLMDQHAAWICGRDTEEAKEGRRSRCFLNVGFGMGLVDAAIESHRLVGDGTKHVICEAHPTVYQRARAFADAVNKSEGRQDAVVVLQGKWQEVWQAIAAEGPYDGCFWDTYEETVEDFFPLLPELMPRGGRWSFCNVYQPQSVVRHIAYLLYLAAVLERSGIATDVLAIPVSIPTGEYDGVEAPYWLHETYLVPRCTVPPRPKKEEGGASNQVDHDPARRSRLGLESGEPLDKLLWKAKHWAVSKWTQKEEQPPEAAHTPSSCSPEAGTLLPLGEAWDRTRVASFGSLRPASPSCAPNQTQHTCLFRRSGHRYGERYICMHHHAARVSYYIYMRSKSSQHFEKL